MGNYPQGDILRMVLGSGPMVKAVLAVLLVFSITCWAIIFSKWRQFSQAHAESRHFLDMFWRSTNLPQALKDSRESFPQSPLAGVFREGYGELAKLEKLRGNPTEVAGAESITAENLTLALSAASRGESARLGKMLGFLATAGNTAPFIGLFGTVWGIMNSFQSIGLKGSASLAAVAPGISEALIATAAGLATAIPAVAFYNYFVDRLRGMDEEMERFSAEFLNLVRRDALRRAQGNGKGQAVAGGRA